MMTTGVNPCNRIGEERIFNFQAENFNLIMVSWTDSQPRTYDSTKVHRQGFTLRLDLWWITTRPNTCLPKMGDVECSFAM